MYLMLLSSLVRQIVALRWLKKHIAEGYSFIGHRLPWEVEKALSPFPVLVGAQFLMYKVK